MSKLSPKRLRGIIWTAVSTVSQANEEEKQSMATQEADLRAFFDKENIEIIDVLRVPGHSRNYKSLDKLAEHARGEGIDAFDKLKGYLEQGGFDVIGVRDANRFARRASLLHFIAESIVEDCDARIYSLSDGWVDKTNVDVWAMVKGYETNKQRKWISGEMARGRDKLAERGLPDGSRILPTHLRLRDPVTGKDAGLIINEAMRPFINDLATVIKEGVAWNKMGYELYSRFGHVDKTGHPYSQNALYEMVYSPTFWGHRARRVRFHPERFREWVFDETCTVPEGILIYRNVLPPVYTGQLADEIKAELYRRISVRGRSRASDTYRYSALCICGECERRMGVSVKHGKRRGLLCGACSKMNRDGQRMCHQTRQTPQSYLDEMFNEILIDLLASRTPPLLADDTTISNELIASVTSEIRKLDTQIEKLIFEQSQQPENVQPYYRRNIQQLADRAKIQMNRLEELERQQSQQLQQSNLQVQTVEEIRRLTLERFWALPDREINQALHRILGRRRIVIKDCLIIGSKAVPK